MPISLHSHSGQFCRHASGTLAGVVEEAIRQRFVCYGLSEHMPRDRSVDLYPEEHDMDPAELSEQFDRFVLEARRLKELHRSQISLLVGLETELISLPNTFDLLDRVLVRHRDGLDYLVGSVHHVNQIPIDFDEPTFMRALRSLPASDQDRPLYALAEAYFNAQFALIEKYRPEVIGHFDLCLLYHPDLDLRADPNVWTKLETNIKLAISYGALFEVNSASLRKGWSTPYPSPAILQLIISLGGRLTLSDDSHGPDRVGLKYEKLFEYLVSNNVRQLWYLVSAMGEETSVVFLPRKKVAAVTVPGNWSEHPFWAAHRLPRRSDGCD